MRRILTVGTDSASCRAAIAAAEAHEEVFAAVGRHPNDGTGYDDAVTDELRELARAPARAWRSARPASTTTATTRRAPTRSARSRAHIALARETGKPLVIHTRAAEDDTIAMLDRERAGARGDPALLLDARPARRVPRARLVDLLRRQRHLPARRRTSRPRRSASRSTACWSRPTRRT